MTEATVTTNTFEDEMKKMVDFAAEFRKHWRDTPFSIDYGNGKASLSFVQNRWTSGYAQDLMKLTQSYGYHYSIHPTTGGSQMLISVG